MSRVLYVVTFFSVFAKLRKATSSFVMPVCLSISPNGTTHLRLNECSWNLIFEDFRKCVEKVNVLLRAMKNNKYFTYEDEGTFMIISPWILFKMKTISDGIFRENQNTHFRFNNYFPENSAVCEVMWRNIVQSDKPQITIWYSAERCDLHVRVTKTRI